MIIEAFLNAAKFIILHVIDLFNFPELPEAIHDILHYTQFTQAMANGASIFCAYTHYQFLLGLFVFCVAVEAAETLWKWARFLLRKIPILGIS